MGRMPGCLMGLLAAVLLNPTAVAEEEPAPVGAVELAVRQQVPEDAMLDVGVVVFDPGIPEDTASHSAMRVFPRIRQSEARYLPAVLRQVLVDSNAWGVVRVLPEAGALAEVVVEATLLESSGLRLALEVRATDATGRLWLGREYVDEASEKDYPVPMGSDPFIDLYRRIANDLLAYRDGLADQALREIRRVALLRYAAQLSPEAFGEYLGRDEAGRFTVLRLPAEGDAMAARVDRIRNQEYLFIDNVDEQYMDLHREMAPTYDLWRQYDREQALYQKDYQQRALDRDSPGRRGSFSAMQQAYNAYRVLKIQEQDLEELARGFNNELEPTVVETSGRVFRLTGTLESQYREWRDILKNIFALEMGLPATGGGDSSSVKPE